MIGSDQLKNCLNVIDQVINRSNRLEIKYCVTDDDRVLEHVSGSVKPLCITQAVPLKLVLSELQLKTAALLTIEAFTSGTNISNKPEIEYLLYLGGSRQIKQTLEKIKRYMSRPYIVVTFCAEPNETQARKPPSQLNCIQTDLKNYMTSSLKDIIEFYGSSRKTSEEILKDALTAMNYLKL